MSSDASAERGSMPIVMIAVVAVGLLLVLGLGRVAGAAVLKARSDTAADAAALAAADSLALGRGTTAATEAARAIAAANGASLSACYCAGLIAEVVVEIAPPAGLLADLGTARSRARAEVDPTAAFATGG